MPQATIAQVHGNCFTGGLEVAISCDFILAAEDAESAQLVTLRFYAGLSVDEAADVMGLARASAYRTWNYAKAWLRMKLAEAATD